MPDGLSELLDLVLMETGSHLNEWGDVINAQLIRLEKARAAVTVVDVTAADVALTPDQALAGGLIVVGDTAANRKITLPSNSMSYDIANAATGLGKIMVTVAGDTGVTLDRNAVARVLTDGLKVYGGLGRADGTLGQAAGVTNAVTGLLAQAATPASVPLTDEQARNQVIEITGTLTKDLTYVLPSGLKRTWTVINRAINPQPDVGTGSYGSVANGNYTGNIYPNLAQNPDTFTAFGRANAFSASIDFVIGTLAYYAAGSFIGPTVYSDVGGNEDIYAAGFRKKLAISSGPGEGGYNFKGTVTLLQHTDGTYWVECRERGGNYIRVSLIDVAKTANNITPQPSSGGLTYLQALGAEAFNTIAFAAGGGDGSGSVPPPDPKPAFAVTFKTAADGSTGVLVEHGVTVIASNGQHVYGGGGLPETGAVGFHAKGATPIGSVIFGASRIFLDRRVQWLECVGQTVAVGKYPELAQVMQTTWGGDGGSTIKLPDLRNRFPRAYNGSIANLGKSVADSIRSHTHVVTIIEGGAHAHAATAAADAGHRHTFKKYPGDVSVDSASRPFNVLNVSSPEESLGGAEATVNTSLSGSHTHTITVLNGGQHGHVAVAASTGGAETAPMHATLKAWIRVR